MAESLLKLGQANEAKKTYEFGLKLEPNNVECMDGILKCNEAITKMEKEKLEKKLNELTKKTKELEKKTEEQVQTISTMKASKHIKIYLDIMIN